MDTLALLAFLPVCLAPAPWQADPAPVVSAAAPAQPDLAQLRVLLEEAQRALATRDHPRARAAVVEAIESAPQDSGALDDEPTAALLGELGALAFAVGELRAAERAQRAVLAARSRNLPEHHPESLAARGNLAVTLTGLGDLRGASEHEQLMLEVCSRHFPDDHRGVLKIRENHGITTYLLGDLYGARAIIEEVLEARERTLPEDHPELQGTRTNLAAVMSSLGDLSGARALEEAALAAFSRSYPEDHPLVLAARSNLADTLWSMGDAHGARALEEEVLDVLSRTVPEDHRDLQRARLSLALATKTLGDLSGARALEEAVVEVFSRTRSADDLDLQRARGNLASTLLALGDLDGARALQEAVLEVFSRSLAGDHADLQRTRGSLAWLIALQVARDQREGSDAGEEVREAARARCAELLSAVCRGQVDAAREVLLTSSTREAEERCAELAKTLSRPISFAAGFGAFAPIPELAREAFVFSESTRGAALAAAAIARAAARSQDHASLSEDLRQAGDDLAALMQQGATSEDYHRARSRREEAERRLGEHARASMGAAGTLDLDVEALSARLGPREALIGFRSYRRVNVGTRALEQGAGAARTSVGSLCAFVLRKDAAADTALALVDLGPIDAVGAAVRAWRVAIGTGLERGLRLDQLDPGGTDLADEALRRLVWDPLLPALGDAQRVVIALDDALHLVPLDALSLPDSDELVGDRWRIETRVALWELVRSGERAREGGALVALGGAAFNSDPLPLEGEDTAPLDGVPARSPELAGILRGSAWEQGFAPLTYTGLESREIAALAEEVFGDEGTALVLEKRKASRAALEQLAPRARWLHVATHGWYAPESIRSWSDVDARDADAGDAPTPGPATTLTSDQVVRGMSPMLLCGLALAGANLPADALGRAPGLITAEELSTLDLSRCELAVLSACDTNVGERRAGQGVASLQKALHMAGARSVITSLWKVPDEATRELMLDFYRRIWVEQKPKAQALWEAKRRLREAKDERGLPRYTTRDWAAWVLTGDPE